MIAGHPAPSSDEPLAAEARPATQAQRAELTLTAEEKIPEPAYGSRTWPHNAARSPFRQAYSSHAPLVLRVPAKRNDWLSSGRICDPGGVWLVSRG